MRLRLPCVVRGFLGIFSLSIQDYRQFGGIDIYIDLMIDLGSICMSSYWFTPAELKGFWKQLTGLQFMRYIRLSTIQS